jgi:hypothetical protein
MNDNCWCNEWATRAREVLAQLDYVPPSETEISRVARWDRQAADWLTACDTLRFREFQEFWNSGWIISMLAPETAASWLLHQALVLARLVAVDRSCFSDSDLEAGIFGWPYVHAWTSMEAFMEREQQEPSVSSLLTIEQSILLAEWATFLSCRIWYFQIDLNPGCIWSWRALLENQILLRTTSMEKKSVQLQVPR